MSLRLGSWRDRARRDRLRQEWKLTKSKYRQALADIAVLAERWPSAFAVFEQRRRPLKIGVDDDIAAAAPDLDMKRIGLALRVYVYALPYQRRLRAGIRRIDLDGMPCGHVSEEEAAKAVEHIATAAAAMRAKRKRQAAAAKEQSATPAPMVLAPVQVQAPVIERKVALSTSLAGLREAARKRRELNPTP